MRLKIDVDTNTFVRLGFVILAFVLAIYLFFQLTLALTILTLSLILAIALNPPVTKLSNRLPGKSRVWATAIAYLMVVVMLGAVIVLIVPPIIQQSAKFASTVPSLIDDLSSQSGDLREFLNQYGLEDTLNNVVNDAKAQTSAFASNLGGALVTGVTSLAAGVANLIFILVLAFLMLIEGPNWLNKLWSVYRNNKLKKRHQALVKKSYRVASGYVNGQLIIAAIAALTSLAVILILSATFDTPANVALPLATIIFITGLIPMFGATIGALLVALVLLLNSLWAAIVFLIYFVVYQQIENNIISPNVQSKTVELSALAILVAILVGLSLFGLLGGIIAIPIAGIIRVLIIDQVEHRKDPDIDDKKPSNWLTKKIKS